MRRRGVILDFHNTLVTAASLSSWLADAGASREQAARIEPVLAEVWARAARRHPGSAWDLDPRLHRRVFTDVLVDDAGCPRDIAQRLHELLPQQWRAAPGALELLVSLRQQRVKVALLSNIALDPRERLHELGLLEHLDEVVLSFEVGLVKPDPRIFRLAAQRLGLPCRDCVMVGDSPQSDGGAVSVGMPTLLVPVDAGTPDLGVARELLVS